MKSFTLSVGGIERREYYEACRESARRMHVILTAGMIIICGAILLIKSTIRPADIVGPVVVYALVMGGYAVLTRINYRDQLAVIDPPVEYVFDGKGWTVNNGVETVEIEWRQTPKLHKTRSCLFIYNDDTSGNLLPLRLMTDAQVKAVETWFANSRTAYKAYQKKEDQAARKKFREEHPGLRLGRTGPVWGPNRRRK